MVDIIALIASLAAVGGLIFTGISFWRLGKTEELKLYQDIYRELSHNLKQYGLLYLESKESGTHSQKEEYLLIDFLAEVNNLCYLIRHGQIKDFYLINSLKDQLITWHELLVDNLDEERVRNRDSFADFKILYRRFLCEKYKDLAWNEKHPHLAQIKQRIRNFKSKRRRYYWFHKNRFEWL